MFLKTSILFVAISLSVISVQAQTKKSCDCTIFPVPQECQIICLGTANAKQIETGFGIPLKTAKIIEQIPKRKSFQKIEDFKKYLSVKDYQVLEKVIINNPISQVNSGPGSQIAQNNSGSGTNIGVQNNTTNIYMPNPPKDTQQDIGKPNYKRSDLTEIVQGVKITIDGCTFHNYRLIVYMTFENVSAYPDLILTFTTGDTNIIVDPGGYSYKSSRGTIGNIETQGRSFSKYKLTKGVKVTATEEFTVGYNDVTKIASFEIAPGSNFYNIPIDKN